MELNEAISHARKVAKEKRAEEQEWRDKKDFIESNERNPKGIYDLPINQCKECAAEHEQLAAWLTELQERRATDKWISVKDKLPEDYGNYLVFTSDNDIDIGTYQPRYIVGTWSMCDADGFYWADDKDIKVIAWKPLPKPYEPKGGA